MDDHQDWISATTAQVLISFASRENATVEDILTLARQLKPTFTQMNGHSTVPAGIANGGDGIASFKPAVPIEESVSDDAVTCLCCGRKMTMLKRHLKAEHGLTEEQYRKRFNLDDDHPLVAPNYSLRKAEYAKQIGLGKYARDDAAGERTSAPT